METFLSILAIIFGILQIILFFKIWGMTNDVREITKYLINDKEDNSRLTKRTYTKEDREASIGSDLKVGRLVKIKSDGREVVILKELGNDLYSCGEPSTGLSIGSYKSHQFELVTE